MKYKALMLDIDGTTVINRPDALPTPKVITAVKKANQVLHVGVATSRTFVHAEQIIAKLDLSGPSILDGGAEIIDVTQRKSLITHHISQSDFEKISKVFYDLNIEFYIQEPYRDYTIYRGDKSDTITQAFCQEVTQDVANEIVKKISDIPTLSVHKIPGYIKNRVWVTITSLKATKQHGIQEVAKILDISTREIIGVGDGYNDFPLLMACGLKVAMGNAVDEIKAIADYIAPPVEKDGVADVIEKFVLS